MIKDRTFKDLSPSKRVYYFMVLAILSLGYLFALLYTYQTHSGKDGEKGVTPEDIKIAYRGNGHKSTLEAALSPGGIMSNNLLPAERDLIIKWVKDGAGKEKYTAHIKGLIQGRCIFCHDGDTNPIKLKTYEDIATLTARDTGKSMGSLEKVSHIHLFGLAFIFYIVNRIFMHVEISDRWKCFLVALPFVAIMVDIISWWLTKFSWPFFAYVVYTSGIVMALCFAFQVGISMYQIVFVKIE